MWILSWKNYKISKLATFISIMAALTRYAGVYCLFSELLVPGLVCIAIGIGFHFVAEAVAKKKVKQRIVWEKV